jgi:hypothetical protein
MRGQQDPSIRRPPTRSGFNPKRSSTRSIIDTAYGSAATLNWVVNDKKIAPHIPVIDKSKREDGTFSREDFTFDKTRDTYTCPAGKVLTTTRKIVNDDQLLYRASKRDCDVCPFKMRCCPKEPARKIPRSIHEDARDAARALAGTEAFEQSRRDRKHVEMLFAHLKRILRLGRLRLRGPRGAQDEFTLAAIAQNLRRLAKLVARPPRWPPRVLRRCRVRSLPTLRAERPARKAVTTRKIDHLDGSRSSPRRFLQQNRPGGDITPFLAHLSEV